jgi:predicted transcriptional regulator
MSRYWVIAPYHADQPELWDRVWKNDLKHDIISIGWYQLGNVSSLTEDQLKERIDRTFPDDPPSVRTLYRRMIRDFYHSIKVGDTVIARRGRKRIAAIGRVTGAAYYEPEKNLEVFGEDKAYANHLDVRWEASPRNKLFRAVVFGMQTLYEVPEEKFHSLLQTATNEWTPPQELLDEQPSSASFVTEVNHRQNDVKAAVGPLTVGSLTAANVTPVFVNRDCELAIATSEMRLNDYSQLPVMQSLRKVDGLISWKSIGKAAGTCKFVRDCMDKNVVILSEKTPLLDAVRTISENEVVLIENSETKEICGLVTTSDLADEYHSLAEPFLLVREIETHLRDLIDVGNYPLAALRDARQGIDNKRPVLHSSDLTFGETLRLLKNPKHWPSIPIAGHQATIMRHLDDVNRIRNRVMHFKPLSKDHINRLRVIAKFMRER